MPPALQAAVPVAMGEVQGAGLTAGKVCVNSASAGVNAANLSIGGNYDEN